MKAKELREMTDVERTSSSRPAPSLQPALQHAINQLINSCSASMLWVEDIARVR